MTDNLQIERGKYGNRVALKGEWSVQIRDFFIANDIKEIEINYAKGWKGDNVSFLLQIPMIEAVTIIHRTINDVEVVNELPNLKYLAILTYCKSELDFSNWPNLEVVVLDNWRPKAKTLFDRRDLKEISINKWKGGEDLTAFSEMHQLESLQLFSPSKIESLVGLNLLKKLLHLEIALAQKLTSLSGIEGATNLRSLEFHSCSKIRDIAPLRGLKDLKELFVCNCGDIATLEPISELTKLEKLLFYESTNILDGDLSPIKLLTRLKSVAFQDRKHYSSSKRDLDSVWAH